MQSSQLVLVVNQKMLQPMIGINEAVALGAALIAEEHRTKFALKGKTIDVTNHSLGMIAINQTAYINSIILPKNAEIPCQEMRPYQHRIRSKKNKLEIFMFGYN